MSTAKKEDILNASTSAFLEHGYKATSMNTIATEAKVSKRTLYKYFSNKEELFTAIIDQISSILELNNEQISKLDGLDFETQLDSFIHSYIELSSTNDTLKLGKLVLSELLKDEPVHFEVIVNLFDKKKERVKWIKQCQKFGYMTKDYTAIHIHEHIESLVHGLVVYPVLFKQKKSISKKELKSIKKSVLHVIKSSFCIHYKE